MTVDGNRIGFMQGRLSPLIDGKIQAFPWPYWQAEFAAAASIGLGLMEWTLDQDRIFENPLMTELGRTEIQRLSDASGVRVRSLTGDCFMQAPFWKASGSARQELIAVFESVLRACADVGIKFVIVPLVDNGSLAGPDEQKALEQTMLHFLPLLEAFDLTIAFESDFPPARLAEFIAGLPSGRFGINFDIGNSASLGWDPEEEVRLNSSRIVNVHVKDRVRGGTTVPLGEGAAALPEVFSLLKAADYRGNYILQTARATDGRHLEVLSRYRALVAAQIG